METLDEKIRHFKIKNRKKGIFKMQWSKEQFKNLKSLMVAEGWLDFNEITSKESVQYLGVTHEQRRTN